MTKRKKCIAIEPEIANELEMFAAKERASFSQLVEDAVVALLENRKQVEPDNLKDTIKKMIAEEFKKQEGMPSAMRNYWGGM